MANQPNDVQGTPDLRTPTLRKSVPPALPAPTPNRSSFTTLHRCPNCGAVNRGHASICPECGENLRTKPRKLRCRHCGKRASSVLVICPNCGRELEESPVRWLVVGAPLVLAALFAVLLIGRWGSLQPLGWVQAQVDAGLALLDNLTSSMDPGVTVELTPIGPTPEPATAAITEEAGADSSQNTDTAATGVDPPVSGQITNSQPLSVTTALVVTASEVSAALPASTTPVTPTPTMTLPPTAPPLPTATETATALPTATTTAMPVPTVQATATVSATKLALVLLPSPTPTNGIAPPTIAAISQPLAPASSRSAGERSTRQPTATATSTATATTAATPTPSETPSPTVSPTPVPQATYEVRAGDTLSGIAGRLNVSVEALMAANNLTAQDAYTLRPGNTLIIPTADSPAATPTTAAAASQPTAPPRTYTVQPGDIPVAIANQFGISVDALLAANGLTRDDARSLRSGQVLIIPAPGQSTSSVPSGAAPLAAASTNSPTAIRLDAPRLRSPESGSKLSCNGNNTLAWEALNFMLPEDQYLLHLGFVNGVAANGNETVVWVLEQTQSSANTLWAMDANLCGLAPQDLGRKWYWYVEVVQQTDGNRVRISAPSETWAFNWN
jgi:LysM repeat protein